MFSRRFGARHTRTAPDGAFEDTPTAETHHVDSLSSRKYVPRMMNPGLCY
jgi:hypothetical protein